MAWSHEIQGSIHIRIQIVELGILSGRIKPFRLERIYKQIDMNRLVSKTVYDKVQKVDYGKIQIFHSNDQSLYAWVILAKTAYYEIWQQDGKTTSRMYMSYNHEYFAKSKEVLDWNAKFFGKNKHHGVGIFAG